MSQQAQNDHYGDARELALDYAEAVNEEIADLFAAGADVVQLDEPWLQARPEEARSTGCKRSIARSRASAGTTAVHICFGYAAMVAQRPEGYSYLRRAGRHPGRPDLGGDRPVGAGPGAAAPARAGRPSSWGCWTCPTPDVETPELVAARVRRVLDDDRSGVDADRLVLSSDCGLKYLPRASAEGKMHALAAAAALLRAER